MSGVWIDNWIYGTLSPIVVAFRATAIRVFIFRVFLHEAHVAASSMLHVLSFLVCLLSIECAVLMLCDDRQKATL
jgi:hypothetical protein